MEVSADLDQAQEIPIAELDAALGERKSRQIVVACLVVGLFCNFSYNFWSANFAGSMERHFYDMAACQKSSADVLEKGIVEGRYNTETDKAFLRKHRRLEKGYGEIAEAHGQESKRAMRRAFVYGWFKKD